MFQRQQVPNAPAPGGDAFNPFEMFGQSQGVGAASNRGQQAAQGTGQYDQDSEVKQTAARFAAGQQLSPVDQMKLSDYFNQKSSNNSAQLAQQQIAFAAPITNQMRNLDTQRSMAINAQQQQADLTRNAQNLYGQNVQANNNMIMGALNAGLGIR